MKKPVNISENFDTSNLYRMPWSMSDNSNSWLEITRDCDISCEYCIQEHCGTSHKSLEDIKFELEEILKMRKCDSVLIAGGEPLTHPRIIQVVKMVKSHKVKPFIITNGVSLTRILLKRLKRAGLFGFVFHVDSGQHRPGWMNKNESELNDLRQEFADMVYEEKGLICSFISTIIPEALNQVNEIISWTSKNIDKVVQYIIVPVRGFNKGDPWDYMVNGKRISLNKISFCQQSSYRDLSAKDLNSEVTKALPEYSFNSFLGGTQIANAPKWLIGLYVGSKNKFYGNLGPKGMEVIQKEYHLIKGRYLSFLKPKVYRKGRMLFLLGLFDKEIRKAFVRYLKTLFTNPSQIFKKVYMQSIILMQPFDLLPNGESDMCDGCPNKTFWNGRLISECRKEEYMKYGAPIQFSHNDLKAQPNNYIKCRD